MFTVKGRKNNKTEIIDKVIVNNKLYDWGYFDKGIPTETLKKIYLDNNRDIDGIFYFIQELAYGGEDTEEKLTIQEVMDLRITNLLQLYVLTLIAYWAIYTIEIEGKSMSDYSYEGLLGIAERDVFIACIVQNMISLFGEISLKDMFIHYKGNSILIGLDCQNRPVFVEGSKDIGQGDEMPKWVN